MTPHAPGQPGQSDPADTTTTGPRPRGWDQDDEVNQPARSPAAARRSPIPARDLAMALVQTLRDEKCEHLVVLDVRGLSPVSDYLIVGSGTSARQMSTALEKARERGETLGVTHVRINEDDRSTWLLADFADVAIHLFEPNTRAYYDIEMLWGDAPRVTWRDEVAAPGAAS